MSSRECCTAHRLHALTKHSVPGDDRVFLACISLSGIVFFFFVTWLNKLRDRCVKLYNEFNHLKQGQQIDQSHPKEGVFFTGLSDKQLIVNEYEFLNAETLHR